MIDKLGGDKLTDSITAHIEEAINSIYGEEEPGFFKKLFGDIKDFIKRGGGPVAGILTSDEASAYITGDPEAKKLIDELYGGESSLGKRSITKTIGSLPKQGEDGEALIRKTIFDIMTDKISRGESLSKANFDKYGKLVQEFGLPEKAKSKSFLSQLPNAIFDTLKRAGSRLTK